MREGNRGLRPRRGSERYKSCPGLWWAAGSRRLDGLDFHHHRDLGFVGDSSDEEEAYFLQADRDFRILLWENRSHCSSECHIRQEDHPDSPVGALCLEEAVVGRMDPEIRRNR